MDTTTQEMDNTRVSATNRTEGLQGRNTEWSGFPKDSSTGSGCPRMGLLLMD
jgi:hypothetical protein